MNTARLQLLAKLYEQAETAVSRSVEFYYAEAKRLNLPGQCYTWFYGTICSIDYNGIVIDWETSRRNCRVDGGRFRLRWEALSDDTYKGYITTLVQQQLTSYQKELEAKKSLELAHKQALYRKLKAELDK